MFRFTSTATDGEFNAKPSHDKARLRHDAAYIGALSIVTTLVFKSAPSLITLIMLKFGLISQTMNNTQYLLFYSFLYAFSLLTPALMVTFIFKKRLLPLAPIKRTSFGFALWGIFGAVGICILANIINSFFVAFFKEIGANVPDMPQFMVDTPISFLLNLFTFAVLPALIEELIWRGYILRTLRPYGDFFAVLISSLLFSLMHENLRQLPFTFIVGLFLGYLYVQTGNIWIPIVVHFINNSLSMVSQYVSFHLTDKGMLLFSVLLTYGLLILGWIALLFLMLKYRKNLRFSPCNCALGFGRRVSIILTSPLFLTSVVLYFIYVFLRV